MTPATVLAEFSSIEVSVSEGLTVSLGGDWPGEEPLLVLSNNDAFAGYLVRSDEGPYALVSDAGVALSDELVAALTSAELPSMTEVVKPAAVDDKREEAVAESNTPVAPEWVLALLPDTRMNLGLDLQGGIDLTLQVELDDAVLSQATRDLAFVRERAAREGVDVISVKRSRSEPVLLMETEGGIDALREYVQKWMADYIYVYSDGNIHAFEMSEERTKEVQDNAVEQVVETLRKRVDATGVKEPSIVKKGGRINVQLPGKVDLQQAIDAIGTTAVLSFDSLMKTSTTQIWNVH